ncbi:MAG: bifunctional 3-demethylubiquinone 3-O-methyltransferase/2-octaprenyl-6-hydroxy phenol methylase [Gammaproteobacteria bacterium]|nr:bifunctional 3-demethylubiquinone 3-O-methyltransferase/2-octaprenyl-6-hydroxy phenol methylase [Gammaproteobacteria bacterium]
MKTDNIDAAEVNKFSRLAAQWWDKSGNSKTLHAINPPRLAFITNQLSLSGKTVFDAGCGGGILSESLSEAGAEVTACDASEEVIRVAKHHAQESGLSIDYHWATAEGYALTHPKPFEVITCMELLEHVPDPKQLLHTLSQLLVPGGYCFLSTINRTLKAYLGAVIGAEYILKLLPKGTHDYQRFIRPGDLSQWLREAGLSVKHMAGIQYNPLTNQARLGDNLDINYLICAVKER